jgi:hypothetical protein
VAWLFTGVQRDIYKEDILTILLGSSCYSPSYGWNSRQANHSQASKVKKTMIMWNQNQSQPLLFQLRVKGKKVKISLLQAVEAHRVARG